MRKERIGGSCLMLIGIFIILLITLEISGPSLAPGWPTYPARLLDKFKLGLILGILFVISRYILLGILKIAHPDFRDWIREEAHRLGIVPDKRYFLEKVGLTQ